MRRIHPRNAIQKSVEIVVFVSFFSETRALTSSSPETVETAVVSTTGLSSMRKRLIKIMLAAIPTSAHFHTFRRNTPGSRIQRTRPIRGKAKRIPLR